MDLPPIIVGVARVGPTTATLVEFTVRPDIADDGVTLAVRGLIPVPGGFYRPPGLARAVALPADGVFGSGVEDCHRRIEEATDARSGPVWDSLVGECRAVGLEL